MTEFEKQALGMSYDDVREQYMESLTAKLSGLEMVVAGILSDCQELLEMDTPRSKSMIRQELNKAKFILFEMMEKKESV
jgi:hypothetical protein